MIIIVNLYVHNCILSPWFRLIALRFTEPVTAWTSESILLVLEQLLFILNIWSLARTIFKDNRILKSWWNGSWLFVLKYILHKRCFSFIIRYFHSHKSALLSILSQNWMNEDFFRPWNEVTRSMLPHKKSIFQCHFWSLNVTRLRILKRGGWLFMIYLWV